MEANANCEVPEACTPAVPVNHMDVPVAEVVVAKFVSVLKGYAEPPVELIVIGEAPRAVNAVHVVLPVQVTVVVATEPSDVGVIPVKYASCPSVGVVVAI